MGLASQLLQKLRPCTRSPSGADSRFGGFDATIDGRLADLETTLRLIGLDAAEYAPLLAPLVDIPLASRRRMVPPEELHGLGNWRRCGGLGSARSAQSQPAVIAFEDLHLGRPDTRSISWPAARRARRASPLCWSSPPTRPEFLGDLGFMRSHHGVISPRAARPSAGAKDGPARSQAGMRSPTKTIDGVGDRTGGVPLFVEEVTRLLLERDAQGHARRRSRRPPAIPLAAQRIDRPR